MRERATTAGPRAGRREWIGLGVLALPTLLVSIDVFVMMLAMPQLSTALHASGTQQLWIMDIYGFLMAGFLITMGTLGDRIGRRLLLLLGACGFAVASVLAAYATSAEMLIGARALLGVAGATLAPSTLALISNMFRDPRQRALAIGGWLVCFMGGAIIGPLVGGALLEHFWWGSVFLVGVPAMLLLLLLGPLLLPEYADPTAGRLDLWSVALSLGAILPIIFGLKELARHGWQAGPGLAIVAGLGAGTLFVRRQHRLATPLLDLRLFADRAFSAALGGLMFGTMLMGAIVVFITQYLQLVLGLSPLRAGLAMLPAVITSGVSFMVAPLLARRFRPARLIGSGLAVSVLGLIAMTQASPASDPALIAAAYALVNVGAGPLVTLGTDLVVGSAPPEKAGSAASMNETGSEFGFSFGVAALGSLGTIVYRTHLTGLPLPPAARDSLTAAQDLPPVLLAAAREAFAAALHTTAAAAALVLTAAALLTVTLLRHLPPYSR